LEQTLQEAKPLSFQCSGCGKCCTLWQVGIDKTRGEHLLKQAWVQQRLADFELAFITDNETQGYVVPHRKVEALSPLASNTQKACVFLNEKQQCLIQLNEGMSAKPLDCQSYPFAATGAATGAATVAATGAANTKQTDNAPLALTYEVTASCLSVAERLLVQFQPIVPDVAEAAALQETLKGKQAKKLAWQQLKRVRLWPTPVEWWQPMLWSEWERRMQALHTVFQQEEDLTPWQALALAKAWLLHPKANQSDLPPLLSKAKGLGEPSKPWRYVLERLCLRLPFGLYSLGQLLWGQAYFDAAAFGASATGLAWRLLPTLTWPQASELRRQQNKQLRAFLLLLLRRRVAMANHQAWLAQWSMAVAALVLVEWYAKAFCLQSGEQQVQATHLTAAIRLVERFYTGHQPRWLALFRYHPLFGFIGLWAWW
jgi:Fe-S-cluster containining protein